MSKKSTLNLVGATVPVSTKVESLTPDVDITKVTKHKSKINKTTYQARLGRRLDNISRKIIDNQLRLTSSPVDMIRIKTERDQRSQDSVSRTVTAAEVMSIILPPIKDIPLRSLDSNGGASPVPSMYTMQEQTYFEIYAPFNEGLDLDDILIRIIFDEENDRNYVMALQVKEILGTIGASSIRWKKYWVTLYDEQLPQQIVDIIRDGVKKREYLNW